MVWLKAFLVALAAMLVAAVVLSAWGSWRWRGSTRALVERMEAARAAPSPARYDSARELEGLPGPVQRYFRTVLTDGQPIVAAVTLQHRGDFNMGESADRWKPFTSWQRTVARRPGFVWDGRIALAPGLSVHVHDAYVDGEGTLRPAIGGLFALADMQGRSAEVGGLAHGELMRFLAEAAWYPTALLPSQGVRWEPVDDRSARGTLSDGAVSVALTFQFADDGSMSGVRAEARGRTVGGQVVTTPWEGRWSALQTQQGMRVPMRGEVAWLTPEGRRPYWRGTVEAVSYEFGPAR